MAKQKLKAPGEIYIEASELGADRCAYSRINAAETLEDVQGCRVAVFKFDRYADVCSTVSTKLFLKTIVP